jgi:hypothetical protein
MQRILAGSLMMLGLVLLLSAESAAAGKKNIVSTPDGTVVSGIIKDVTANGKSITIEIPAEGKKQPARTMQIKITDTTKIEYAGIDKPEDQQLKVGYSVAVTLDEKNRDTADEMRVSNKPFGTPKKKKKNK